MSDTPAAQQPAGWYYAQGDPPGTQRYWDGAQWQGGPQAVQGAGTGPGAATSNLASPGSRILARIIDAILVGIIGAIIGAIIGGGAATQFTQTEYSLATAIAGFVGALIGIAYELYFTSNGGATLGKKALNIKIVNEGGSDIDLNTAAKRYSPQIVAAVAGLIPILGIVVSLIVFVIGVASLVMIFSDDRNQAVWDKIADTIVIKS